MSAWAPFTDQEVRQALGLPVQGGGDTEFGTVGSDSRAIEQGDLFVALVGERFDGHDFLTAVRDRGATAAVVRRGTAAVPGLTLFEVDDTLHAWGELARLRRARFEGPVIAITGQNGKTSTKEMVAAVLGTRWRCHRTRINNNNMVGVPLSILEAPSDTEALVIEAGANQPGEIARYREIIDPDVTIVTNAGAGHLEGFGSVANVLREKLALTIRVPLVIVGTNPPDLAIGAHERGAEAVLTAGVTDADVVPEAVELLDDGRPRVSIDGQRFDLAARGLHQAGNAMFAWALVRHFGFDTMKAARALEAIRLPGGRGELVQHGALTLLNDCYNANPESFVTTIELAEGLRHDRQLVFVAGTMRELGAHSERLHRQVSRQLAELHPELLVLVGDFVEAFHTECPEYRGEILEATDALIAGAALAARLRGDELLVLKGSRGAELEAALPLILASSPNS